MTIVNGKVTPFSIVIAGLDPAIHGAVRRGLPMAEMSSPRLVSMDHRVKPGGDDAWVTLAFEDESGAFGNDRGLWVTGRRSLGRMGKPRPSLKRGDIGAIALAIAIGVIFLYAAIKHPDWQRATGFGPEWQCNAPGRGGSSFCIRKVPTAPADQTTTPD